MSVIRTDEHPEAFRGVFRTDLVARALYAEGAGIARAIPSAIAVPVDVDDATMLVRWARALGYSLIPRGSGSGMAAGAVGEHVVVDMSRFTDVGEIDIRLKRIRVGPGVLRNQLDAAARAHGLHFPVDPSSGAFCTIGGMTATNAAGARTLLYGSTRKWINGIHCIFDDGTAAWVRRDEPLPMHVGAVERMTRALASIGRTVDHAGVRHRGVRKESSGYHVVGHGLSEPHLVDVLVGSEGTLALFAEIEVQLADVPAASATVLASFESLDRAAQCAVGVVSAGAAACEMLDRSYLDIAERNAGTGIDRSAEAVLLIEVEGIHEDDARGKLDEVAGVCKSTGATQVVAATSVAGGAELWALRHAASPTLAALPSTMRSMQFIEDSCVPPSRFAHYVRGVRSALRRADTAGVIFGHAGDAHAHVNPLLDLTRADWRDTMRGLLDDVCDLTARLGGTLSGEHGDGRLRAPLLSHTWNAEARAAFMNVKAAADPSGVFNVGCKLPAGGADPLSNIRFDPLSPQLPPEVRAVLDQIERERAWHRFRLGQIPA